MQLPIYIMRSMCTGLSITDHPLIPLHINDTQLLTEFHKPDTPERFGQDVCQLFSCAHMINVDLSSINTAPDEMVPCVDMLTSVMVYRILAQCNC